MLARLTNVALIVAAILLIWGNVGPRPTYALFTDTSPNGGNVFTTNPSSALFYLTLSPGGATQPENPSIGVTQGLNSSLKLNLGPLTKGPNQQFYLSDVFRLTNKTGEDIQLALNVADGGATGNKALSHIIKSIALDSQGGGQSQVPAHTQRGVELRLQVNPSSVVGPYSGYIEVIDVTHDLKSYVSVILEVFPGSSNAENEDEEEDEE